MKSGFLPPKAKTYHFWARKSIFKHPDKRKAGAQNSTAHPGKKVISAAEKLKFSYFRSGKSIFMAFPNISGSETHKVKKSREK
nr:MAG TPA: hypothetical protein [Caudoviricetes sp.]